MKVKPLAALTLLSIAALSSASSASAAVASASASMDWNSFTYAVIDTDPTDGIAAALNWTSKWSNVSANVESYQSASSYDWATPISAVDGVATALASPDALTATFSSPPGTLNASAWVNRDGSFTLSAHTLVTFSVMVTTSIDMNVPINGNAYAWAQIEANGPGFDGDPNSFQKGGTGKISWANGSGPQSDSGKINASLFNGSANDMDGSLNAFASVTSYGFNPVVTPPVPEPETYAMLLAGLGLMATIARRRKNTLS